MEHKNPMTGAESSRKFREAHRTPEDMRKTANVKKVQRAMYKHTDSKVERAHKKALSRARSQRYRQRNKLKKTNDRCKKDGLPLLSLEDFLGEASRGDDKQELLHQQIPVHDGYLPGIC